MLLTRSLGVLVLGLSLFGCRSNYRQDFLISLDHRTYDDYLRDGAPPAFLAAQQGDLRKLKAIVDGNVDGRFKEISLLQIACNYGHVDIVDWLVQQAGITETRGPTDATLLTLACENDNPRLVKLLLDHGLDPNEACEGYENTPLHDACYKSYHRVARVLLENGAKVDLPMGRERMHPIHLAAASYPETVQILVDHGADANQPNRYGETPLMVAVELCREETVRHLLGLGADPKIKAVDGRTALHQVGLDIVECRSVLSMMIVAGADINVIDDEGQTPLFNFATRNLALVELAIESGAEVNIVDQGGDSPLHLACGSPTAEQVPIVQALLAAGADRDRRNQTGQRPIDIAVLAKSEQLIALLRQ